MEMIQLPYLLSLCLLIAPLATIADSAGSNEGRHRLDLSLHAHEAREFDVYTALPGYTYTLANQLRLGIVTSYTYISPDSAGEAVGYDKTSGFGDTSINLQYSPSEKLTSSPWVPDTLGFTLGLDVPTGDADKGLGADYWAYSVGLGWAYNAWSNLHLVPAVDYAKSFSEGSQAIDLEYAGASVGFYWIAASGLWFGYTPYLERDLKINEWADDHSIIIGKIWPNGLGFSLEYGQVRRIDKSAKRDDYTSLVNFYYQFGRAP